MIRLIATGAAVPEPVARQAWPLVDAGRSDSVVAAIEGALAEGADHIVFAGGDALLQAAVLDWLQTARQGGAKRVEAWTDGRVLLRKGAAQRLLEAGLTHVGVVLFGAEAASHDFVAGSPGRFAAAIRSLRVARKAGLRTVVVAPVLRPTFRDLPVLVQRSLALGVGRFELVTATGPDRDVHGLVAHLAMAAPHIKRALQVATTHRRAAHSWWVPACLLGAMAPLARDPRWVLNTDGIASHFAQEHVAPCQACAISSQCGGPLAAYVAQHGAGGMEPVADPPAN